MKAMDLYQAEKDEHAVTRAKLARANALVLTLIPQPFRDLLTLPGPMDTLSKLWEWRHEAVDEIISCAPLLPVDEGSEPGVLRALCPLCLNGSTAQSRHQAGGFKVRSGLLRHLEGSHRTEICQAIEVVMTMRWDEFRARHRNEEAEADEQPEL